MKKEFYIYAYSLDKKTLEIKVTPLKIIKQLKTQITIEDGTRIETRSIYGFIRSPFRDRDDNIVKAIANTVFNSRGYECYTARELEKYELAEVYDVCIGSIEDTMKWKENEIIKHQRQIEECNAQLDEYYNNKIKLQENLDKLKE